MPKESLPKDESFEVSYVIRPGEDHLRLRFSFVNSSPRDRCTTEVKVLDATRFVTLATYTAVAPSGDYYVDLQIPKLADHPELVWIQVTYSYWKVKKHGRKRKVV